MNDRVYGVTVANALGKGQLKAIAAALAAIGKIHKPTVRLVIDTGMSAKDYVAAAKEISKVAYIMAQVYDSQDVKKVSTKQYLSRCADIIKYLGPYIVSIEVLNEGNGDWLGATADVVAKMSGAYDLVVAAGIDAVLCLYYDRPDWDVKEHEMFKWATANVPLRMKLGLKQVLVSYYEEDNGGYQPDKTKTTFQVIFDRLGNLFLNSLIGMGECGSKTASKKAALITYYYRDFKVKHDRFIWGGFWWYFDFNKKNGDGDMTVPNAPLLDVIKGDIA